MKAGRERVYLGLGSNLGDRQASILRALESLAGHVQLEAASFLYETEPWGYADQPPFLNCVAQGTTLLSPRELLAAIQDVERKVGRQPSFPNGPRLIDVDILLYGQYVVGDTDLEIPHPGMAERAFVLVPLAEIASDYIHPVLKLTVGELLARLKAEDSNGRPLPAGVIWWGDQIPLAAGP